MKHPQLIETVVPKSTYQVPTFRVTNEGIVDGEGFLLKFCKGDRSNEEVPRQEGFFTETLIAACVSYLQENNVGELSSRETSEAITCIQTGLLWLGKRAEDRKIRGVQGTYQK